MKLYSFSPTRLDSLSDDQLRPNLLYTTGISTFSLLIGTVVGRFVNLDVKLALLTPLKRIKIAYPAFCAVNARRFRGHSLSLARVTRANLFTCALTLLTSSSGWQAFVRFKYTVIPRTDDSICFSSVAIARITDFNNGDLNPLVCDVVSDK